MTPFRRLLGYAKPYQHAFFIGLVCIVAKRAVQLAGPAVLRYAIARMQRMGAMMTRACMCRDSISRSV